jgi:hypothetical protein
MAADGRSGFDDQEDRKLDSSAQKGEQGVSDQDSGLYAETPRSEESLSIVVPSPTRVEREKEPRPTESSDLGLHRINMERLSNVSAVYVLMTATIFCGLLAWLGEDNVRNGAMQILGVIVGAAAGAIWQQGKSVQTDQKNPPTE